MTKANPDDANARQIAELGAAPKITLWTVFVVFAVLNVSHVNAAIESNEYLINIDHLHKILKVQRCFAAAPRYLYANSDSADRLIRRIYWNGDKDVSRQLWAEGRYIYLPVGEEGCLSYQVSLQGKRNRLSSSRFNQQHPHEFITSIDSWLWKDSRYQRSTKMRIKFVHQRGINVSAPWSLLSRSETETEFLVKYTPDSWAGMIAFGRFEVEKLPLGNSRLRVAVLAGNNSYHKASIMRWVKKMAGSVASVGGEFPIKNAQVLVVLQSGRGEAVPWGQVNRAGGSGVLFIVNPNRPEYELMADWTAAHEFSHLLLPYTPDDRWLSEGFASYYQNISRARSGLLDEKTAWKKLLAGFERGRKSANQYGAPPLKSAGMRYLMQMYWGGAVIALKADVALLERTAGRYDLSRSLQELSHCCLETGQEWSAFETFSKLDQITGTEVFTQLYYQEIKYKSYPKYQLLLQQLGIRKNRYGEIYLDDNSNKAAFRKKIIHG